MTTTIMEPADLLAAHDQDDFPRTIAKAVLQRITEADVHGLIGAGRARPRFNLSLLDPLGDKGQHLAHEVAIGPLFNRLDQRHSVVGRRLLRRWLQVSRTEQSLWMPLGLHKRRMWFLAWLSALPSAML